MTTKCPVKIEQQERKKTEGKQTAELRNGETTKKLRESQKCRNIFAWGGLDSSES